MIRTLLIASLATLAATEAEPKGSRPLPGLRRLPLHPWTHLWSLPPLLHPPSCKGSRGWGEGCRRRRDKEGRASTPLPHQLWLPTPPLLRQEGRRCRARPLARLQWLCWLPLYLWPPSLLHPPCGHQ